MMFKTKTPFKLLSIVALLNFFSINSIIASDFHVSDLESLKVAAKDAQAGDTIYIEAGTYIGETLHLKLEGEKDAEISIKASGNGATTLLSPLFLEGRFFKVEGLCFEYEASLFVKAQEFRLTHCVFDNVLQGKWLVVDPESKRIEIDHCVFQNKTSNALYPKYSQLMQIVVRNQNEQHHIHHNMFRDVYEGATANGYETLQLITENNPFNPAPGDCNTIIEDNLFVRCNGEREIVSIKSNGNVIRRNTFRECKGGLAMRHGHNNVVLHNYLLGGKEPGSEGIRIQGDNQIVAGNYFEDLKGNGFSMMDGTPDDLYVQVNGGVLAFNTFVNCKRPLMVGLNHPKHPNGTVPVNCKIVGNVFYADIETLVDEPFLFLVQDDKPENWTWSTNLVSNSIASAEVENGVTYSHFEMIPTANGVKIPSINNPVQQPDLPTSIEIIHDILGQKLKNIRNSGAIQFPVKSQENLPLEETDFEYLLPKVNTDKSRLPNYLL